MSAIGLAFDDSPVQKRHLQKERQDEKSKKIKSHRKSKHGEKIKKKEKKKKKKKKKKGEIKESSESDDSDSNLNSGEEIIVKTYTEENAHHKEMMEFALSAVARDLDSKNFGVKNRGIAEKPGQSSRELNPYWKDGGSGLPKGKEIGNKFNEATKSEKISRLNFKIPSDETDSVLPRDGDRRGNWKKKSPDAGGNESKPSKMTSSKSDDPARKVLSDAELNALAAKAVKAEILGNRGLSAKLKSKLEEEKKKKAEAEREGSRPFETDEMVLLTKTNLQGFTVPAEAPNREHCAGTSGNKKRKIETHDGGQRQCYFPDDDKYSLKDMFVKEKATTAEEGERDRIKMFSKGGKCYKDEEEEIYLDAARYKESEEKQSQREKTGHLNEAKSKQKSLEGCKWCLENKNKSKNLIVEIGKKCYLCLPEETSLTDGHCLIVPIHHTLCSTVADEDVWEEIKNFKTNLCNLFLKGGKEPVFFENARGLHRFPHMVLHCVPLNKDDGDMAPIYFKKALLESETEWSNNKKVVDLKTKDVRRSIPKGLPYFAVDFGREGGFAHVIEDEKLFPKNFAEEIIGGMLDLDHRIWRKHQKQSFDFQRDKFLKFIKMYREFKSEGKKSNSSKSSSTDSD